MNLGIFPPLTKDYILSRISQEDIMSFYLQVPIELDKLIICPKVIRTDNNPTFGFYYNNQGRLRGRDLGNSGFWGDCFDAVAWVTKTNVRNKKGFNLILHTIAKDFRLHKYKNIEEVKKYNIRTKNYFSKKKKSKEKIIFKIKLREFNYHDKAYWNKFNVNYNLLKVGKVYFAQEIYMRRLDNEYFTKIYTYNPKDPAYCYYGGKDKRRIDNWKIYYPLRRKGEMRFHSNSSFVQGKHLITCGRIGVITKSYKDVLSFRSFGIQSIAPSAESILISKEDYFWFSNKFDFTISCMDYDRAGQRMAQLMRKTYNTNPIMFTDGRFNSINYKVKDFAAYVEKYGKERTIQLLQKQFNEYKEHFYSLDTHNYNLLKHTK